MNETFTQEKKYVKSFVIHCSRRTKKKERKKENKEKGKEEKEKEKA